MEDNLKKKFKKNKKNIKVFSDLARTLIEKFQGQPLLGEK
jgi:hypothetical protein